MTESLFYPSPRFNHAFLSLPFLCPFLLSTFPLLPFSILSQTFASLPLPHLSPLLSSAATVGRGGCVLIPCHFTGIVYDLIEVVVKHLRNISADSVPVYFVAEHAKSALAFASVYSSWYVRSCLLLRSARLRLPWTRTDSPTASPFFFPGCANPNRAASTSQRAPSRTKS